jgi:hypothetical protein
VEAGPDPDPIDEQGGRTSGGGKAALDALIAVNENGLSIDSVRDRAAFGSLSTIYLAVDGRGQPEVPGVFALLPRWPTFLFVVKSIML